MNLRKYVNLIFFVLIFSAFVNISCSREKFGGIGVQVHNGSETVSEKNSFVILHVIDGGTASSAGLLEGDIIRRIDGIKLDGLRQDYIVSHLLRGKEGSIVNLEIEREGNLQIFRIPRGTIILQD